MLLVASVIGIVRYHKRKSQKKNDSKPGEDEEEMEKTNSDGVLLKASRRKIRSKVLGKLKGLEMESERFKLWAEKLINVEESFIK